MPAPLFRLLAVAACLVAVPPVFAHQDDAAQDLPPPFDCDHPPKGALSALPDPVAEWAQLDCKPYGQFLVQSEGWVWRYPASWTSEVSVPPRMDDDTDIPGEARYFKTTSVVRVAGAEAARSHDRFAAEVPAYQFHASGDDKRKPTVVYTLVAVNDVEQKVLIHFLYHSDADIWGVVCAPACGSEQVFKVYRREQ
jgi:hypothetical protein